MCSVMFKFHTCFSCVWVSRLKFIFIRYLIYVQFSQNSSKHLLPLLQTLPVCVNMAFHLLDQLHSLPFQIPTWLYCSQNGTSWPTPPFDLPLLSSISFWWCFLGTGKPCLNFKSASPWNVWFKWGHWIFRVSVLSSTTTGFENEMEKMFIQRQAQHLSHRKGQKWKSKVNA